MPQPISDLVRYLFEAQSSQEFQLSGNTERSHAIVGLYLFDGEAGGVVGTSATPATRSAKGRWERAAPRPTVISPGTSAISGASSRPALYLGTQVRHGAQPRLLDRAFTQPNGRVLADFSDSETFRSLSPRINVAYRAREDIMFYAQASRGFKAGGYNIRANTQLVPESALPFRDETAVAYELGAKTAWLEGRLTANAAMFHTQYQDIQLSVFTLYDSDGDGDDDAFFGDFKNAGAGTIRGAELEFSLQTGGLCAGSAMSATWTPDMTSSLAPAWTSPTSSASPTRRVGPRD